MSQLHDRITIDPEICHGKTCIRGMRYPLEAMLDYLAGGDTIEDVVREFPDLERADLLACLEFARQTVAARGSISRCRAEHINSGHDRAPEVAKERSKRPETDAPAAAARYVRRSAEAMPARGARIGEPISVHRSELAALFERAAVSEFPSPL